MTVDGSVAKTFVLWMQLRPTNTKSAKTMAAKAILCQFINITNLLVESFGLQILTIHHSLLAIRHSLLAAVFTKSDRRNFGTNGRRLQGMSCHIGCNDHRRRTNKCAPQLQEKGLHS
jgi:hypothetical protein